MKRYDAILIIASSEIDSNLYYATKFLAPDPFIFIQKRPTYQPDGLSTSTLKEGERALQEKDEKIMVIANLEIDRAKQYAEVDYVLSFSRYEEMARKKRGDNLHIIDIVDEVLAELEIKNILVPANFSIEYADILRERGYIIDFKRDPFFEQRAIKSHEEIENISTVLRITEDALGIAIQKIRDSAIKDGLLYLDGEILTSETIKKDINIRLLENGCIAQHTIVACGLKGCDPHNQGDGPLEADRPIIIDIFPRSDKSKYFADITRTVVRGRASDELKRIYETIIAGQELAFGLIRDGADGKEIHQRILSLFTESGYTTGLINGRMQGFFHGTGHGIGLDIHEAPRISKRGNILTKGNVITIEPGLYYIDIGGIRIEDMIVVTEDGYINLTEYPKVLEL